MVDRILGVLRLNSETFEAIEHDDTATVPAAVIVAVAALATGLGTFLTTGSIGGMVGGVLAQMLGWLFWSASTYFIGAQLFGADTDLPEMLRVIGFAQAPQILSIIPGTFGLSWILGMLWAFAASFVGIRAGLDLDNKKTLITVLIGGVVVGILKWMLPFV